MQAVVLAAGEGTRLRPLTFTKPKVMLPIANKPILEHLIDELVKAGIDEVVLIVGYKDERVRNHFGKEWNNVSIEYATQRKQQGTADALKAASHLVNDEFLMLNGDAIVSSNDITKIVKANGNVIAVKEVPNPQDFGVVEIQNGFVKSIIEKPEKPATNLINAGIYKFDEKILDYVERTQLSIRGEYEITESISLAIANNEKFKAVRIEEWIDIGYPWDMLKANEYMLNKIERKIEGKIEENVVIKGKVVVGEDTIIKSGSYIVGPTIIGKNCEIGPNSYIRPYTTIGNNCHIGICEIKNSIVMTNTKIPHFNYVGDSIIGENCNFGAGTKIANLRLDDKEIHVSIKGRKIPTGRRKLGAVVGDNVKTGINVSINVGCMIGNDVFLAPHTKVEGFIEPYSKVF
ncbi:glucose-1-phosphate thymidylyltransferase [Archaeoglobales archaeon]|nr:MAG: glucose-1-phosphate thymidylyltransferase [Archaeoglobales archaeon]